MITDDLIKKEFISQIVSRDVNVIYNTQEQVVREVFPGENRPACQLPRTTAIQFF